MYKYIQQGDEQRGGEREGQIHSGTLSQSGDYPKQKRNNCPPYTQTDRQTGTNTHTLTNTNTQETTTMAQYKYTKPSSSTDTKILLLTILVSVVASFHTSAFTIHSVLSQHSNRIMARSSSATTTTTASMTAEETITMNEDVAIVGCGVLGTSLCRQLLSSTDFATAKGL